MLARSHPIRRIAALVSAIVAWFFLPISTRADSAAVFFRAINFNGPELQLDGHRWEAEASAPHLKATGTPFENQSVPL